jgi:hypothetical protein
VTGEIIRLPGTGTAPLDRESGRWELSSRAPLKCSSALARIVAAFECIVEVNRKRREEGKPETFTFLGFTHYCGKRRSNGTFIVWRETAKKRIVAKLRAIKAELRRRMHEPVASVGEWLKKVTWGYYQYHAVPGNLDHLRVFMHRLRRLWRLVLIRRSQRSRATWDRICPILDRWIPVPRVLHPYPMDRFVATHPRWEPYA